MRTTLRTGPYTTLTELLHGPPLTDLGLGSGTSYIFAHMYTLSSRLLWPNLWKTGKPLRSLEILSSVPRHFVNKPLWTHSRLHNLLRGITALVMWGLWMLASYVDLYNCILPDALSWYFWAWKFQFFSQQRIPWKPACTERVIESVPSEPKPPPTFI